MFKTLNEIADIYNGADYKPNPPGDSIPIYGTGGLMGYTSKSLYEGPAVLSGRKGSINNPIYVEGPFWNVDTIFCIKPKALVDVKWLYYSFLNEDLTKLNEATGVPSVSSKSLYKLKINWFEYHEQRRIAQILSTCDAVIEKTRLSIAKYKAIKQGMLHDLFTRGIDVTTGKLRPRYADAPELYKESKLGMVPREWKVVKIEEVSSIVTNGFVGVATPFYTNSDSGILYLYGTNIREDKLDYRDIRFVSKEFHSNHIKSQLKPGDMLCVQSGHIGTCAVIPDYFPEANCHALIITRFNKDEIFPQFISFYLNSDIGKKELDKIIIGSTVKHINTSELTKHFIIKPPFKEQELVAIQMKEINKLLKAEQTYLAKLQMLKSGLMGDLLSGRVRVEGDVKQ